MFSLIFRSFEGSPHRLREAFHLAFGDWGVSFELAFDREAKHRPCELLANLTQDDAERKAAILRESGATIKILPTAEVADVKHHADECWPTHRASNGETFTEWDGIVVSSASLSFREQLLQQRTKFPNTSLWDFEIGYNHEHPTHTLDRHGLRTAREYGADLATALTECFPNRRFLLDYRACDVSFCQFTKEHPAGITPGDRRLPEDNLRRCVFCNRRTPYVIHSKPDTEFANVQFADCAECDTEFVLWADNEVVLIEPKAR